MNCNHCGKPTPRRDENRVKITGVLENDPTVVPIRNSSSRLCLFTLNNVESYTSGSGVRKEHVNYVTIEVLGRNIDRCLAELHKGDYCEVNGYIRIDDLHGVEKARVRAHSFQKE